MHAQYVERFFALPRISARPRTRERRRRPLRALLLGLGLGCFTPIVSTAPAAHAREMAPNDSFLTVDIPGETTRRVRNENTLLGEVRTVTVAGSKGDAKMGIAVSKLPEASQTLATDGMIYRSARRKLLRRYDAESTRWESCHHAGLPCRRLDYVAEDGRTGLARFYLTEDMMVVVNGVYETDRELVLEYHDSTARN